MMSWRADIDLGQENMLNGSSGQEKNLKKQRLEPGVNRGLICSGLSGSSATKRVMVSVTGFQPVIADGIVQPPPIVNDLRKLSDPGRREFDLGQADARWRG